MTAARILIVEDDRVVARDIEQQLVQMGHTVVGRTGRGEEAIALALQRHPTLVVMDIRLDGRMDGIEAARLIREKLQIPVIFLTAYADDQTLHRAALAEPFGYLLKPFDDSQLRTAVEVAMHKNAAERGLRDSERRYAVTLASIADAVIATDGEGRVAFMNPVAATLTGWPAAEALGQPISAVFRTIAGGAGGGRDTVLLSRDGREMPVDDSAAPIVDDEGRVTGVVRVFRDVTERRRAAEAAALQQANARLGLALRGSSIGIWDFDIPDGDIDASTVTTVNFWEQHGYGPDVPTPFSDVVQRWHPDDRQRVVGAIRAYLAGETKEYEITCRMLQRDGSSRWRLVRGVALRDDQDRPTRFIGSSVDITDRIAAEESLRESEERFRAMFESAAAGMVQIDLTTLQYTRVNQKACEMTGYPPEEILGHTPVEFVHPDDREATRRRFRALARSEIAHYDTETRLIRKDGGVLWISAVVSAVRDAAARPYAVGIVQDLTDRKRMDEELRQAKEVAEAGNRAKDEFLANVSHEIRTPMNAILGMTELVLDTPLSENQRQSLRTVRSAAASLLAIINDLLDFSKIQAGKLEIDRTPFRLRALVGETMRTLAMRAHRKGLELVCSVQPGVPDALIGDGGRVRQILINLVGNAIKFTSQGEVVIHVDLLEPTAGEQDLAVRFLVRDTGIGIPPEKQSAIFRAFEQEDMSTTRKYGGTGLGLTISARLAALMGGTITVESEPQRGSTFTFTARFAQQSTTDVHEGPVVPVYLKGLRVLIVDDNAVNGGILEEWLRGWKMNPTVVKDGVAAMDALWHAASSGQAFALVLLDAHMPDTDGLTLAAKMRERPGLATARIILLTSGDRPGDLERFRELRLNAHLLKPFQQEELLDAIHDVMSRGEPEVISLPDVAPVLPQPTNTNLAQMPLRVLVAEDNQLNAQLLRQLLLSRGHAVRLAGNGREAVEMSAGQAFDLLILDLHMPEVDGFQAIAAIRERERASGAHLPAVALTARSRSEDRARCLAAGMDEFVTKPIDAAMLWAAIDRVASH